MRLGRGQAVIDGTPATDHELVGLAAAGDTDAFEELYRRHVQAAWRVAHAVTGNRDDAADAVAEAFTKVLQILPAGRLGAVEQFRSYLLTATRNAGVDVLRRKGRAEPTADAGEQQVALTPGPSDRFIDQLDASLVSSAFRTLPERWRSVLWLTEVEGIAPREVAERLGLTPNNAAQIASRARAGLRERYLQAHLRADVAADCRFTVEHLGAHVAGKLAPRDIAKVDQHLAGCDECRRRHAELEDVGSTLRRIVIPLPMSLAPLAMGKFKLSSQSAVSVRSLVSSADAAARMQKPLAFATSSLVALGVISAAVVGQGQTRPLPQQATRPMVAPEKPFTPSIVNPDVDRTGIPFAGSAFPFGESGISARDLEVPAPADASAPTDLADTTKPSTPVVPISPKTPTPPPAVTKPVAQLTTAVKTGAITLTLAAGQGSGSCTGVAVLSTGIGCQAPSSTSPGATVSTDGTAVPTQTITAPLPL